MNTIGTTKANTEKPTDDLDSFVNKLIDRHADKQIKAIQIFSDVLSFCVEIEYPSNAPDVTLRESKRLRKLIMKYLEGADE